MPSDRSRNLTARKVVLTLLLFALGTVPISAYAAVPRLAILKSSQLEPFEMATAAITEGLAKQPVQPEVLTFDLGGEAANAPSVLAQLEAALPQLVITVGTLATEVMLHAPGNVPVIFTMVLYPEQSGFLRSSSHPVAGVSLDIPLAVQFSYLRQLLPKAQRLGVLYSAGETGAIVEAARKVTVGFGFELRAQEVGSAAEVVDALNKLLPQVDAMWSVADSNVFTSQTTPAIILAALRQGLPLFGISTAQVRAGAVLSLSADYADIGRQTAEYVNRALGGADLASLPVATPRTTLLTLNEKTAHHLGFPLPPDLKAAASEVLQ